MRRRASVYHLSRTNIDTLVRRLRWQDTAAWPPHLQKAFDLMVGKAAVDAQLARHVVISAARAAHSCAFAISDLALHQERQRIFDECRRSFKRLGNNVRLLPAKTRKRLNDASARCLGSADFDAEILRELLGVIITELETASPDRSAKSALKAVLGTDESDAKGSLGHEHAVRLLDLYDGLNPADRIRIESAVQELLLSTPDLVSAEELFACVAMSIGEIHAERTGSAATAIIDYVEQVAKLWLDNGLRAGRAFHPENPHHKSTFHIFVDVVLAAFTEPGTSRHDMHSDANRAKIYEQHKRLPPSLRPDVSPAARRSDIEWLVSDDHVKQALSRLKPRFEGQLRKTASVTP